jgi:hypothetical protein
MENRMKRIGYNVVVSRGDFKPETIFKWGE